MSFVAHLDKRVNIKEETQGAADGAGGFAAPTWTVIYRRVPFAFMPASKRFDELIQTRDKEEVLADFLGYLEYRSGVKEGQRIYWGGRVFEIKIIYIWREKARMMKLKLIEKGRNES